MIVRDVGLTVACGMHENVDGNTSNCGALAYLEEISVVCMLDDLQDDILANPVLEARNLGLAELPRSVLGQERGQIDGVGRSSADLERTEGPVGFGVGAENGDDASFYREVGDCRPVVIVEAAAGGNALVIVAEAQRGRCVEDEVGLDKTQHSEEEKKRGEQVTGHYDSVSRGTFL